MPIDIGTFKTFATNDIARPNAYEVHISGFGPNMQIFCVSAQLPGVTRGVASAYFQGVEYKLAGDHRYDLWSASFYGQNNIATIEIYDNLLGWFNTPRDLITNIGTASPFQYFRQVRVNTLDHTRLVETSELVLLDAWITNISPIDLSYASENELIQINVEIAFSEMTARGVFGY